MMDNDGVIYKIQSDDEIKRLLEQKFVTQLSDEEQKAMEQIKQEDRFVRLTENRAMRRERERQERREARRIFRSEVRRK